MKVKECHIIPERLRLGITVIVVLMVVSSPTVILVNPALMAAPISSPEGNNLAPSTIGQDGDFATQAALSIPRTFQSTDIANSKGIYEVSFISSTTGAIDKIEVEFPAGTNIGQASVIEKVGIGGGVLTKVGTTLTYDVTTPVNIPAGTFIRLEISAIKNPITPSSSLTATITTLDSGGAMIDGPTSTNAYEIRGLSQRIVNGGQSAAVAPGETIEAPGAMCAVNEVVVGGGYGVFEGNAESFMVPINEQAADNGWFVKMNNRSPPGGDSFTFAAQAVCLQL